MLGRLIGVGILVGTMAEPVIAQHRASAIRTAAVVVDVAFLSASGNANASMVRFGEQVHLSTRDDLIRFGQAFHAVRSEVEGVEGVDSYRGQVRLDYRVRRNVYLMGLAGWERDLRSGIRWRWQETAGLAFEWSIAQADILTLEAGISAFQQRDVRADPDGLDGSTTGGHLAARFRHVYSKNTYFSQSLEVIPNFTVGSGFRTVTESEASARVSNFISLKLNYLIRYTRRPGLAAGSTGERLAKSDRTFTAGVSFSF